MEQKDRTEKEFAYGVGFMTAMAAVRDASSTKNTTMKKSAEMIGYGMKFDMKVFLQGMSEALIIALESDNDEITLMKYLNKMTEV